MKIAIQGGQASFHHAAALQYFTGLTVDLVECSLFSQVCDALAENRANYGIMAIENTVAGTILPNYLLLIEYSLHVVGETHLRIDQNLMALSGQTLADIHTARSHPMALLQCSGFFHDHPAIKPQEAFDTADSAKEIRRDNLKGVAAIAGRLAAELYELEILAPNIENEHTNYTRFLVLSKEKASFVSEPNKATITFSIPHEPGALVDVLKIFGDLGCNLTLIQSVPLAGKPYEYAFCVDFEYEGDKMLQECLNRIRICTDALTLLGAYRRGDKPN